jgi:hypothetical protein
MKRKRNYTPNIKQKKTHYDHLWKDNNNREEEKKSNDGMIKGMIEHKTSCLIFWNKTFCKSSYFMTTK